MHQTRIALIGDYNPEVIAHRAIPRALTLAATSLGETQADPEWLGTATLLPDPDERLRRFDGIWCVPASPYASMEGALAAIEFARRNHVPFLGTCGGFQHALIEFARNALRRPEADHAETSPAATMPLIAPLACSLVEQSGKILLQRGSRVQVIYRAEQVLENYHCRFGLNRAYESWLQDGGDHLHFTGRDPEGEVRVFELANHPFFVGTLFQPERSALSETTHPLISAFLQAASTYRRSPEK